MIRNFTVAEDFDPADAEVVSDGLRAYTAIGPDTTISGRSQFLSVIRRPARSLAGFTAARNSVWSMSRGFFCPRTCAVHGSEVEYWRWPRKRVGGAVAPAS